MSTRARIASLIVVLAGLVALGVAVADGGSASESLKIRRPVDGARLRGTVHVLIRAPSDTQRVAFYLDGHLKNMDDAPPWRYDGSGYLRTRDLKVGRHRLTVRARRAGDKLSVVGETFYVVRVDKKPPTIAFRAPRSGATVSGVLDAGSRNCEVAAADRSGVARVDFFLDGAKLEGDSKRPFTCTLDTRTYPNGFHKLSARALDKAGNTSRTTDKLTFSNTKESVPEPAPAPVNPKPPPQPPLLDLGFEDGLNGWSTGGAGDAIPTVVSDISREGSHAARVALTGSQIRSELILEKPDGSDVFEFHDGDSYYYGFSFYIVKMVWGAPGLGHNLIWQLHQRGTGDTGSPPMGLALVDYQGNRGLWTHSTAMGGARFLRPLNVEQWYDVVVRFTVSNTGHGSYDLYLNGELIDSRKDVTTLLPGFAGCMIQTGLYRGVEGDSEIRLDSVRLGTSLEQVGLR